MKYTHNASGLVVSAEQATEPTAHGLITVPVGYWKVFDTDGSPLKYAPSDAVFSQEYTPLKGKQKNAEAPKTEPEADSE